MKALFWKELRENFKWALLGGIGLAMAFIYGIHSGRLYSGSYQISAPPLLSPSFLSMATFGCAVAGLILGLLQILPELRRDQWAALLFRPATRDVIFLGKASAGLLLYFLATGIPILFTVVQVATPGHFPFPFVSGMVWPGVADIMTGAVYYFAALFFGLYRGHWFGVRLLGIFAALSASVAAEENSLTYVVLENITFFLILLFIAAWAAIQTNERFAWIPIWGRAAVIFVLFYGIIGAWSVVWVVAKTTVASPKYTWSEYVVTTDGQIYKKVSHYGDKDEIYSLDGTRVRDPKLEKSNYESFIADQLITSEIDDHDNDKSHEYMPYRIYYSYYNYNATGDSYWFYVPSRRLILGYHQFPPFSSLGAFGQNGFQEDVGKAQPFLKKPKYNAYRWSNLSDYLVLGRNLYYLDFENQNRQQIFSSPDSPIYGQATPSSNQDDAEIQSWFALALKDKVLVLNKTGKTIASLPYHQNVAEYGSIDLLVKPTKDRFYLEYSLSHRSDEDQRPDYLEEMDAQGNLLRTETLPYVSNPDQPRTWVDLMTSALSSPGHYYGYLVYEKIGALFGSQRLTQDLNYTFGKGWNQTFHTMLRLTLTSLFFSVVAFAWAWRNGFSSARTWQWTLLVFLLNLPGLLTFLLVVDWPVKVACPTCQKPRSVRAENCPHCQSTWPTHALEPTDIRDTEPALV